jgi:hypothetical protein
MRLNVDLPAAAQRRADLHPERRMSLREIRVLGTPDWARDWAAGMRIAWEGRTYRVAAAQDNPGDGRPRYLHLAVEDDTAD